MPFQARHSIYKPRARSFKTCNITKTSIDTGVFDIFFLTAPLFR